MIAIYNVQYTNDFGEFEFISEGSKDFIKKVVSYTETDSKGVYNLAFGDLDAVIDLIEDQVVTNNGDRKKVIATFAATLPVFFINHLPATVIFRGSTDVRTKYYRREINNNIDLITERFIVLGSFQNTGSDKK